MKAILPALALSFTVAVASAGDVLLISPMDLLFSGDTLLGKRVRVEGQKWYGASFGSAMSSIESNGNPVAPIFIDLERTPIEEHRKIVEKCSGFSAEVGEDCNYTVVGTVVSVGGNTGVTLKDVHLIPAK